MILGDCLLRTSAETMEGLHTVRQELVQCALSGNLFSVLSENVPRTWMNLLQTVAHRKATPSFPTVQPWSEFQDLLLQCGFAKDAVDEFKAAIVFLHNLGMVFFVELPEQDFVYLRPQWVLDILKLMVAPGTSRVSRNIRSSISMARPAGVRHSSSVCWRPGAQSIQNMKKHVKELSTSGVITQESVIVILHARGKP